MVADMTYDPKVLLINELVVWLKNVLFLQIGPQVKSAVQ